MSPVIIAAHPDGTVEETLLETTESMKNVVLIDNTLLSSDVNLSRDVVFPTGEDAAIPPALLASLFLILGVVVFIAVTVKRMSSRPEMMQCTGHIKSSVYGYGSINPFLNGMHKAVNSIGNWEHTGTTTRPTKFVSVSEMWRAQQSKNKQIIRILEEPEEEGKPSKKVNL